jgi:CelD/BcsL family acetyltransferase involved in cellulose biosynthesis
VKLTPYEHEALFDQLQPEWNDLLRRSTSDCIFSTWEWQSTWWDAYKPGQLWVVACRDEHDHLVGLAPWFVETHPTKGRVVRSIGCVEVTDYLDILVDREYIEPVLNCFASFVAVHSHSFDLLDLCNIPEQSPTLERFAHFLRQHGLKVEIEQQEVCPVIQLPDTWEDYLSQILDKKERHEIRRKLRRAEGESNWYFVGSSHNLAEETDRFFSLMSASHPEKAGFLRDAQNAEFFRRVIPMAYEKGWLQLSFLSVGGNAAATYLNFDYNRHILVYNSGLLPGEYGHLSPGIVLLAHNIRHAIETQHTVFDFLRGSESYKYRMGAKDIGVFMLKAQPSNN